MMSFIFVSMLSKTITSLCDKLIKGLYKINNDFEVRGCITQQKQRKQKSLHYYLLEKESGEMKFSEKGKEKEITS